MNDPLIVTMAGPGEYDLRDLSNFEAGAVVLSRITRANPGITWGELALFARRPELMAGMFDVFRDVGHAVADASRGATSAVMDVGRGAGGTVMDVTRSGNSLIGDAFDATGDKIADAVRVFTSKKVIDGLNSSYESFSKSGGITGAVGGGMFKNLGGGNEAGGGEDASAGQGIWDFIVNLGAGAKAKVNAASSSAGLPEGSGVLMMAVGGILLFFVVRGRR